MDREAFFRIRSPLDVDPWISSEKRACLDRTDQLPDGQVGSSPETAFEGVTEELADESSEPGIITGPPRQSAGKQAVFC